jgi:hypothetical protein
MANAIAAAALILLCIFAAAVPSLFELIPGTNGQLLVQLALLASILLLPFASRYPKFFRSYSFSACGILIFFYVAGLQETLFLTGSIVAWFLFCRVTGRIAVRLVVFSILAVWLYRLRIQGFYTFGFWWIYVHFLKFLAISLYPPIKNLRFQTVLAYFFSPPFLLGPLMAEFLLLDTFEEEMRFSPSPDHARSGAKLILIGIIFLLAGSLLLPQIRDPNLPFLFPESLQSKTENGFYHLLAGAFFFLVFYWKRAGITALGAGIFRLFGCTVPYDYDHFYRSKTYLEFCQRYHGNVRNSLWRYVYMPVVFLSARLLGLRWASYLGIFVALLAIGLIHFYSFIPNPGVSLATHYSLIPTLQHRLWEGIFIFIAPAYFLLSNRCGRSFPRLSPLISFSQIGLTMIFVAALFYNTYAQIWLRWSNWDFLKAMVSW